MKKILIVIIIAISLMGCGEAKMSDAQKTAIETPIDVNKEMKGVKFYHPGTYKVGVDIPPGEYKVLPTQGRLGYFQVNSDSAGNMIYNDSFETQTYVTIEEGQYLDLDDCYIVTE